ncbi:MAG: hypothetical protein M1820_006420 [Bogoriella megaspora]|nr:MAG: hypothetical protein M1820_006420 [Bogoriella megaspora]
MATDHYLQDAIKGYPDLAGRFARMPETAIVRIFSALGWRLVLHQQGRLLELEKKLCEIEIADSRSSDPNRRVYARNWARLYDSSPGARGTHPQDSQQQSLLLEEIKAVLKDYYGLLLPLMELTSKAAPNISDLEFHQRWLLHPDRGDSALIGEDTQVWGIPGDPGSWAYDLISARARQAPDPFSDYIIGILRDTVPRWLGSRYARHLFPFRPNFNECGFHEQTLRRTTHIIMTAVVAMLVYSPIVVLYAVESTSRRQLLIAILVLVFLTSMGIFTKATRSEIFAAAAASVSHELLRFLWTKKANRAIGSPP